MSGGVYRHTPCPACGEPYPITPPPTPMNPEMKFELYKMIGCLGLLFLVMALPMLAFLIEWLFIRLSRPF